MGELEQTQPAAVMLGVEHMFLTEQMGWKKGLKLIKERGEHAIMKELQQIHDMEGFQPKHWFELTPKK